MPGYKSDHFVVKLKLDVSTIPRGPGSFKMNTLYLFDFNTNIKNAVRKLVRNIADSTPNSLWELIKSFCFDLWQFADVVDVWIWSKLIYTVDMKGGGDL